MIGDASLHRGCDPQCLVNSAKVEMHEVQRNHVGVAFQLLLKPFVSRVKRRIPPPQTRDKNDPAQAGTHAGG